MDLLAHCEAKLTEALAALEFSPHPAQAPVTSALADVQALRRSSPSQPEGAVDLLERAADLLGAGWQADDEKSALIREIEAFTATGGR